jgi:hypothetical protein
LWFFIWINFDNTVFSNYNIGIPKTCKEWVVSIWLISTIISVVSGLFILTWNKIKKGWYNLKRRRKDIDEADYKNHKSWFEKVFKIKDIKESKHNLVIKLNLGHETLREKDILSLIAKRIYDTYRNYLSDFYTNWIRLIIKTILFFVGAILIVWFFDKIDITGFLPKPISDARAYDNSSDIYCMFYDFVKNYVEHYPIQIDLFKEYFISFTPLLILKIILVFIFYFLVRRLWNFAV